MTISTHMAIGATIGLVLQNPLLAFIAGFTSHFIVDIIPHGDSKMAERLKVHKQKLIPYTYGVLDYMIAYYVLLAFLNLKTINNMPAFTLAIAGSLLPDLLVVVYEASKGKLFRKFYNFHFYFHDMLVSKTGDMKLAYGITYQAIFIILLLQIGR
jgi:hypothetical protein